jgi:hypothetical protein
VPTPLAWVEACSTAASPSLRSASRAAKSSPYRAMRGRRDCLLTAARLLSTSRYPEVDRRLAAMMPPLAGHERRAAFDGLI